MCKTTVAAATAAATRTTTTVAAALHFLLLLCRQCHSGWTALAAAEESGRSGRGMLARKSSNIKLTATEAATTTTAATN